ncbi:MAG: hypothetical protein PHO70_06230 [Candidatus Omnitrophica bacterium]|nr:hypothetical protein [Candidatus Omnitrophota bacterium]
MKKFLESFNPIACFLIVPLILLGVPFPCFAQEDVTVTTYYPSPTGNFTNLTATNLRATNITADSIIVNNQLIVNGRDIGQSINDLIAYDNVLYWNQQGQSISMGLICVAVAAGPLGWAMAAGMIASVALLVTLPLPPQ